MVLPKSIPPRRDPASLVREVDAAIRLHDTRALDRIKERLQPRWWEGALTGLLFVAGLGLIIVLYPLLPRPNNAVFGFLLFFVILFILALIASLESLLARQRALRDLVVHLLRERTSQAPAAPPARPTEDSTPPEV